MSSPAASHRYASASRWRLELQESIAEIAERAVFDELAKHEHDRSYYPQIEYLAILLQRVAQHFDNVDRIPIAKFLEVSLDAAVIAGPGRAFQMTDDFLDATDSILRLLIAHDQPVTDLLLAKARYQAVLDNTGQARGESISRAIDASRSAGEQARALLMLAEYHIDGSRYRNARTVARACEGILASPDLESLYYPQILTTIGLSYFFTNIKQSEKYFIAAIQHGTGRLEDAGVRSAVSTAHHYLGRIQAARSEFRTALDSYITGERLSDHRLAGTGWYHLRMAEVLLECGRKNEVFYHLQEAQRIFELGQVISSGDVVLNATWSRYYASIGDADSAEQLLIDAMKRAQSDRYPRGELICLVQLVRLRLRHRRYLSCAALLKRAGWVFVSSEAESGLRSLPAQLKSGISFARGILSSRPSKVSAQTDILVSCPCGNDHVGSGLDNQATQ